MRSTVTLDAFRAFVFAWAIYVGIFREFLARRPFVFSGPQLSTKALSRMLPK